jgi:hypothetical protein
MKEFICSNTFVTELSNIITQDNVSIIEGICMWCEQKSIEIEEVVSFIKNDKILLSKIKDEANSLSLLKKEENVDNNLMEVFVDG